MNQSSSLSATQRHWEEFFLRLLDMQHQHPAKAGISATSISLIFFHHIIDEDFTVHTASSACNLLSYLFHRGSFAEEYRRVIIQASRLLPTFRLSFNDFFGLPRQLSTFSPKGTGHYIKVSRMLFFFARDISWIRSETSSRQSNESTSLRYHPHHRLPKRVGFS